MAYGVTVNSFSSVSLAPPIIQWSIAKSSQSYLFFTTADQFAVNVLASNQVDIANHFARSGGDKFSGMNWRPGLGEVPLLADVAASFECVRHSTVDAGDHTIILGRVERFANYGSEILLFARGSFGVALQYPSQENEAPGNLEVDHGSTMLGLLWGAFSTLSHRFQQERDAEGLSISQAKVLSFLERQAKADVPSIAQRLYLSEENVQETLRSLLAASLALSSGNGTFSLTRAGEERVHSVRRRVAEFEASQLSHLTADEVKIAKKVLRSLG